MTIRYGLIGSGMMGQEHIRNLNLLEGCEVTAVSDPDEGMRQLSVQTSGGTAKAFGDYKEMLGSGLVDALLIAAPNDTHHEILLDVLEKYILGQNISRKPLEIHSTLVRCIP